MKNVFIGKILNIKRLKLLCYIGVVICSFYIIGFFLIQICDINISSFLIFLILCPFFLVLNMFFLIIIDAIDGYVYNKKRKNKKKNYVYRKEI